jgi:hypothetical protein
MIWKSSQRNSLFHDELEVILNEKTSKKFGDFDQRKSTLKILPEDMIRNTNNWAAETKSFESSVQFDISEILQNDFVSKWVKNLSF